MPEKRIGKVTGYHSDANAARIHLEHGPLSIGDTVHIRGPDMDVEERIDALQLPDGPTEKADPGDDVGVHVRNPVEEGALVFRVDDPYDEESASVLDQVFEA